MKNRVLLVVVSCFVLLAACTSDEPGATADSVPTSVTTGSESAIDDDCTQEELAGGDDEFAFTTAYRVVAGEIESVCFGSPDDALLAAWEQLAAFSPTGQRADIGVFSGFQPDGAEAEETLAFVSALDPDGVEFQMAINLDEAARDGDELLLTLAHEFTHVFTATPPELDRSAEAIDGCETYDNGDGCYTDTALMTAWIAAFWPPEVLDTVDPFTDDPDAADDRCQDDGGYFGAYAATNPEEDFAEAFSAYVFDLVADTPGQQERLDWIDEQPGLAEFRDRARAAGLTPLDNLFGICGL